MPGAIFLAYTRLIRDAILVLRFIVRDVLGEGILKPGLIDCFESGRVERGGVPRTVFTRSRTLCAREMGEKGATKKNIQFNCKYWTIRSFRDRFYHFSTIFDRAGGDIAAGRANVRTILSKIKRADTG